MVSESFANSQKDLFKNIEIKDLLNSLDEVAIITDNENKIIFYNSITPIILSADIENYLYKKIDTIPYFENLLKYNKIPAEIKDLPTGYKVSHIYKIGGKDHYFEHENVDIYDETGTSKATLFLIRDITKEIEVEILLSLEINVDKLSGLYNSKCFYEDLEKELSRCSRYGYDLSILFIDINNFKHINDILGHIAGDEIIKLTGKSLLMSIRKNVDTAYRYGGDEFVMILPNTPAKRATIVTNRVLSNFKNNLAEALKSIIPDIDNNTDSIKFKASALNLNGNNPNKIGLSIGIAEYKKGKSAEQLINEADHAMYEAKKEFKEKNFFS